MRHPGRADPAAASWPVDRHVTTRGDLVVLELDAGVIASPNLFDLGRRTLRFTPDGAGYRAQNLPVQWDAEFGAELKEPLVTLRNFAFPYSGKSWNSFVVGQTGTISFGVDPPQGRGGRGGGGGTAVGRFAELREAASTLINTNPVINVFLKPSPGNENTGAPDTASGTDPARMMNGSRSWPWAAPTRP